MVDYISPHLYFSLSFHSGLSGKDAFVLYGKVWGHTNSFPYMTLGLKFLASRQTPPTNPYTHICSRKLAHVPEISLWDSYYFDILLDRYYYFSHFTHEKTKVLFVQSGCSTSDFSFLHCLPELAQTHVHWVGDAILPFCLLSSPPPPAFSLS